MLIPVLVTINLILFILIYRLARTTIRSVVVFDHRKYQILVYFVVLFCVFAFYSGDYYHYMLAFDDLLDKSRQMNIEPIYQDIANIAKTYHIFRIFVWGSAIFCLIKTIDFAGINRKIAFGIFSILFITQFAYARVSLAMSLMFLGLSTTYTRTKFYKIIGYGIVLLSLYFHKSAFFGIGAIVASIIFKHFQKSTITISLLCFPIAVFVIKYYIIQFLSLDFDETAGGLGAGQTYMTNDAIAVGPGEFIKNFLWRSVIYLTIYLFIRIVRNGQYKALPENIRIFANCCYIIVYVASLFILDLGINTTVIYNRFLNFMMIPATIFLSYCYCNSIEPKITKLILKFGTLNVFYSIAYSIYIFYLDSTKYLIIILDYLKSI